MQDLGGWQDDHAEKDVEESQRGSGQDALACRCPLEQALLGRRPQWHGKAKLQFVLRQLAAMTARCLISTLELPECDMKGQDAESAGTVPSAGAP